MRQAAGQTGFNHDDLTFLESPMLNTTHFSDNGTWTCRTPRCGIDCGREPIMRIGRVILSLLVAFVLPYPIILWAQVTTATLYGVVHDSSGAVLLEPM
jgi:hypothetical protein